MELPERMGDNILIFITHHESGTPALYEAFLPIPFGVGGLVGYSDESAFGARLQIIQMLEALGVDLDHYAFTMIHQTAGMVEEHFGVDDEKEEDT